jgi:hypothetical protein
VAKAISLALLLAAIAPTHAIILYGSGDPETNTTPPPADLAANGWDLQGSWGGPFQGTPIDAHHFITAAHLGGTVGQIFSFRGVDYTTISTAVDPASDLQIWEVAGAFPAWAELYDGVTETGLDLVVFGRGATRGPEVRVNGALKGWQWGVWDQRMRWGRNRVAAVSNDVGHNHSDLPQLLVVEFNSNATADEAHLGVGDSGGGVFIKQDTTWRLAGINYSVDGPYNTSVTGPGFIAAIFDEGGLYKGAEGAWVLTPDLPTNQAGSFIASRIKARLPWIQSVLGSPLTPVLVEAADVTGPFQPLSSATVDTSAKTIRFTPSEGTHFYQIEGVASRITSSDLTAGVMTLHYQ